MCEKNMKKSGVLIVISGPSGVGKGTICKRIMERHPDIKFSISMTTRAPRANEVDGVDYYFTDKANFEKMIQEKGFLEYAVVHGNYYGTPIQSVENSLKNGENILLDIDIQGALQVKRRYPKGVYVFIIPPSMTELKNRIIKRGSETDSTLDTRFKNAFKELELVVAYDYYIINDDLDNAVNTLDTIFMAEKQRVSEELLQLIKSLKAEN